jgi:hypothetical protein
VTYIVENSLTPKEVALGKTITAREWYAQYQNAEAMGSGDCPAKLKGCTPAQVETGAQRMARTGKKTRRNRIYAKKGKTRAARP